MSQGRHTEEAGAVGSGGRATAHDVLATAAHRHPSPSSPAGAFSSLLRSGEAFMHGLGSRPVPLPVRTWRGRADEADRRLLEHCHGPTLDIGCGPGRMAAELVRRGLHVTGVDVAAEAVRMARARGVVALLSDVFAPLPGEGLWRTVLLADGNIGIGGDPDLLLRRLHRLLDVGGRVVAELAPPGWPSGSHRVTVESDGVHSAPFWWAVVTPSVVAGLGAGAGFAVCELHRAGHRTFAVLHKTERTGAG